MQLAGEIQQVVANSLALSVLTDNVVDKWISGEERSRVSDPLLKEKDY